MAPIIVLLIVYATLLILGCICHVHENYEQLR